jgi:exopolysaccharide production protein ExoQ
VVWVVLATKPIGMWLQMSSSVDQNLEGDPLERAIYAALLAIGVLVLVGRREKVIALFQTNLPILLYFSYCAVSVVWSDFPDVAFKRWIKAVGDLVMVTIVLTDRAHFNAILRFLARLGFLLLPTSILLIRYYPQLGRKFSAADGTPQIVGVATDKNMLGAICLLFGVAAVWRILQALRNRMPRAERRRTLLVHGTILAMTLYLLAVANSMTSLACFSLASSLMVALSFPIVARRRWTKHTLVFGVVVVVSFALFFDSGGSMVKSLGRDPTLTDRTIVWKEVLHIAGNSLFGTGFESFWMGSRLDEMWTLHWWHPNEAHNGYIEIYLNLGWIGIALLALVIGTGYRNVLRVLRRDPEAGKLRLAYFVIGIIYSLTEAGFRTLSPAWFCFLMATLAIPRIAVPAARRIKESVVKTAAPEVQSSEIDVWPAPAAQ